MEIANLVLEYLKVLLNWPLLILGLALVFKDPLSELLRKIRRISLPGGGTFDAEADEASSELDQVSSVTPPRAERAEAAPEEKRPEPAEGQQQLPAAQGESVPDAKVSTETRVYDSMEDDAQVALDYSEEAADLALSLWEIARPRDSLDEGQFYESFRQLAVDSPMAAVREAYQRIRLSGQRLLQDVQETGWRVRAKSLQEIFEALAEEELVNPDATEPAARLDRIYSSSVNSNDLSAKGALSFVEAAQKLENLLAETRLRLERGHMLRAIKAQPTVQKWLTDFGFKESDVQTALTSKGIRLKFTALTTEIGNEPRYEALIKLLRGLARAERITIRVSHPDQGRVLR